MGAAVVREHEPDRTAGHARGGLPPHRGPRRQDDPVHPRQPGRHPRSADVHLPGAGRHARSAPGGQGVVGEVPRPLRRGLGSTAGGDVPAPEGAGLDPRRRRTDADRSDDAAVGRRARGPARVPVPADGGLRRVPGAHRRPVRPGPRRTGGAGHPRQHPRVLHPLRQRRVGRGDVRHDRRAARPERDRLLGRAADRGARARLRRPRRDRHAARRQHVPPRLGVGDRHAVAVDQAGRRPLRRHPHPDGRVVARPDHAGHRRHAPSSTT